ncbi:ABC transporter permease [Streptomyces iconiensis]|uniref:ABC transporter permease n=1 Tax=Streptomyces iconiensis TaxID=1384038 RepID=A0ABT7A7V8_9ACTN|nr:ABC transporter permease [Streptomyces iconiensis]MDJ1137418.1 ABC transporter permease [Streptomyces iconiensis]
MSIPNPSQLAPRGVRRAGAGPGAGPGAGGGAGPGAAGLRGAVAFEWTKLVSLRSTWYLLLAAAVAMALAAPGIGVTFHDPAASPADPAALAALYGVGTVVAALAMLSVTGEYATGCLTTTLQCVPDRARFLLAKCLVQGGVSFAMGVALGVGGTVAGALSLDESTFHASTAAGQVLAIGAYTALLSVLTLGLATVVRSSAGVLTCLFLLLFLLPSLLRALPGGFPADVADVLPQGAGERLLAGATGGYGPAVALPLLAAWAFASTALALRVLRRRDA